MEEAHWGGGIQTLLWNGEKQRLHFNLIDVRRKQIILSYTCRCVFL